jgi:MlaD protein
LEYNQFPAQALMLNMVIQRKAALFVWVVAALGLLVGCNRIGGRTITVEFRNAEAVHAGEAVYLAGVKIGQVSDEPSLVNGRARVPVLIDRRNKDGVPGDAVFLVKADPTEPTRQCLVAYSLGSGDPRPADSNSPYVGVSNSAELMLTLGAEKANKLWKEWTK